MYQIVITPSAKREVKKLPIEKDTGRNFYLSAAEAEEYGMIDEAIRKK